MRKNIKAILLAVLATILVLSLVACGHQHAFSTEWTTSETHHWHAATCNHDEKQFESEHQFGAGTPNAEGTLISYTCRVCQYVKTEVVEHTHTFLPTWTTNETHHWHNATCGHQVKGDEGEHNFDAGVENNAGTHVVYTCQTCNYTKTQALPPHVCTFEGEWLVSTPATILAEGEEYRECTSDKCNLRETRPTSKVAVVSIAVTTQPSKTAYYVGENFAPAGIVVTATGANDTTADVTALVSYDKTTLVLGDTTVTVTYEGKTAVVEITVEEAPAIQNVTVTQARTTVEAGTTVLVEGYFVGVADEGSGAQKEILLKDVANDNLIAVQGIPDTYGTWPNVGYEKGDKVQLYATLVQKTGQPKKFLQFDETNNPANVSDTVVSKGNIVSYDLDNVTTITNWADFKAFFADVTQAQTYSYVRFKGTMYRARYDGASDGVALYRPHMNPSASGLASIKPDDARAVGFRANAIEANVGSAWGSYFNNASWTTSINASQPVEVDITAVYTNATSVNFIVTLLEANWLKKDPVLWNPTTPQEIVTEMAEAYLRQVGQLEYDQYSNRRMTFATPEEATAQELGYFDCSSYVTSVYTNAYGIDAIPFGMWQSTLYYTQYVKEHVGQEGFADAVAYWEALDYTTKEEQNKVLDDVRSMLQPGDILVYRHGSSSYGKTYEESNLRGHAILYMGNNQFSHSRGTSYQGNKGEAGMTYRKDPTKAKDRANASEHTLGTVQYLDASEVINIGTGSRMLFGERSDMVYNFSILRPLARTCETPTLTEQMAKRLTVAGLSFEKLTSAGINSGVTRGQEITYTLEITNHYDNEHKAVAFKDVMPEGVSFVSSNFGATATGNTINGTFNVAARQTLTLTWTVKVNSDTVVGTKLCNETTINGLLMKDITNIVVGYTTEQFNALATKAREFATSGATFDDPLAFAREVYKQALGVDLFGTHTTNSLLDTAGVSTKDPAEMFYNKFNTEGEYASMVAPNMYGGWDYYSGGDYSNNNLIRTVYEHNLTIGDVIVCRWYENTRVYIYVGNGQLVTIDTLTNTCAIANNGDEGWVKNGNNYEQKHLLGTLYAYQRYVVLRPAQLAN